MDWNLISVVGARGAVLEAVRGSARTVARYANPLARLPWWRADLILVVNPETRAWLPARHQKKTVVFPHVVLDQPRADPKALSADRQPTALFVGRLLPWKGMALALRALALLDDWDMIVCGSGPDEHRLKRIAEKLKVDHRVKFLGWVSASRIRELMLGEADVLLFPSLHDEGGFVVAEALAAGLPVVCLKRGGPPEIGGTGVTPTDVSRTVEELARAVPAALWAPIRAFPHIDSSTTRLRRILETRLSYLFDAPRSPGACRVDPSGPFSASDGCNG